MSISSMSSSSSEGDLTPPRGSAYHSGSTQSILTAMNSFVTAVDAMEGTVMIPSRLMDMSPVSPQETNTCKALVPAHGSIGEESDLYSFYNMLKTIRGELVRGQPPLDEEEEEEEGARVDDATRQTTALFRHHLRGLFHTLKQLTNNATNLTTRYQEETGDTNTNSSSTNRFSSFVL